MHVKAPVANWGQRQQTRREQALQLFTLEILYCIVIDGN